MKKKNILSFLYFGIFILITFLLSTTNGFAQDSVRTMKILLVNKTKYYDWQTNPTKRIFLVGRRIKVNQYSNDKILRGKIETITDSSITIKGKTVKLKDIHCLSSVRGKSVIVIGSIITAVSVGLITYGSWPRYDVDDNEYILLDYVIPGALCMIVGLPTLVIGVIDLVTVQHYHMDDGYLLKVKTVKY